MKLSIIFAIFLCFATIACNKTEPIIQKNISTDQAGMLSSILSEDEMLTLTELTISGPLNGSDFRILRNMAQNCSLSILDLKDATIVAGGNPININSDGTSCYLSDNDLSTGVFKSCIKLTSIVLPRNLKSIGDEAFSNCKKLSKIEWFEGLDSIGEQAFYKTALTGDILLPKSLRTIGRRAFFENQIEKVTIQSDITVPFYDTYYIIGGNSSFANCEQLTEIIVEEGCTKLEIGFQGCSALSSVSLPNTMTHIGATSSTSCNYIFKDCESLHSISLPDGLQFIGTECFYGSGITEIEIPESVQQIKKSAFANTSIKTMKVKWNNPLAVNKNIFDGTNLEESTLYVPDGTLDSYKNHVAWGQFGIVLEEN